MLFLVLAFSFLTDTCALVDTDNMFVQVQMVF